MQLCLVRHAIAGDRDPDRYPDDGLRPVTADGAEKMRVAAAGLKTLFVPDLILSSPLLRARQTADIIGRALKVSDIRSCDALASGDGRALLEDLAHLGLKRVLAVGHQPHLTNMLSLFLAGTEEAVVSEIKKGAAALVTFDDAPQPHGARLESLIQPGTLRSLAKA